MKLSRFKWMIFGGLSVSIGVYPALYFILDRKFGLLSTKSPELLSDLLWNVGFYGHIIFGGVALMIGWIQFHKKFRDSKIHLHRKIGITYVFSALISGLCGMYIAFYATGGIISMLGFGLLGIFWITTTYLAFEAIKNRDILRHEEMMIYSFAACFAAVTLRIWLPSLTYLFNDFFIAYRMVAWLCWVPNIIVAYLIINQRKSINRATSS